MELIDKREAKYSAIHFRDLNIGDCYQDKDRYTCIKTGNNSCIFFNDCGEWKAISENCDAPVIRLKAIITVER